MEEVRQVLVDPSQFSADWRVVHSEVTVSNIAWTKFADASPRRIAIFFMVGGVGNGQWVTDPTMPISAGFGLPNGNSMTAERLTLGSHGGLAQSALYGIGAAGVITMEVCEIFWSPIGGR